MEIDASCEQVFSVLHDYSCRLDWDRMLSEARILGGSSTVAVGVRTICTGSWRSAFVAMETEYVSFQAGEVAAVKMTNRPPWFSRFAATIRHTGLAGERSRVTYTYSFEAKPRALAWLLDPILNRLLASETLRRLESLKSFVERRSKTAG